MKNDDVKRRPLPRNVISVMTIPFSARISSAERATSPSGPSRPIDTILAAMSSIDLTVEGLSESFSVLPNIKSGSEKSELKARLRYLIEQLEALDGRISF